MFLFKTYLFITRGKNVRKQYENSKLKIIAPTCNDEFELPDGSYSVSDIQDYIEYIIKKHETLTIISPIHVYTNRIKIKDKYKLELQTSETMKLFGSTKELIDKTKNRENVPRLEVVELVLVQCNLVININKSLKYYTLLHPINLMHIC